MPKQITLEDKLDKTPTPREYQTFTCTMCGKEKKLTEFYLSQSPLYKALGYLPICKKCVGEIFNDYYDKYGDSRLAIYFMCEALDVAFVQAAFTGAETYSKKAGWDLYQSYFRQVNSLGKKFDYPESFHDGEKIETFNAEELYIDEYNKASSNKTRDELVVIWGVFPDNDLHFLQNEYEDWCRRYDVSSKSMEVLIKRICYSQLRINKLEQKGEYPKEEIKTLRELMGDSALKPISESAAQAADKNTLGTWIKLWENEKPVPKPDKEFEDVDNVRKLIRVWFLGHFCKMQGIKNEISDEYEAEVSKNSVILEGDD